jgi:hypothetical protein
MISEYTTLKCQKNKALQSASLLDLQSFLSDFYCKTQVIKSRNKKTPSPTEGFTV